MSLNLDQDVTNLTAQLAAKTGVEGVKIAGKLAKEMLMVLLSKVKETEKNRTGLMSLKQLSKSGEELHVLKVNEKHLEEFQKLAEEYRIGYAAITNEGKSRIFIKESQIELVKNVMEDILEKQKLLDQQQKEENELMKSLDKFDFKEIGEEEKYFRESINVEAEKVGLIDKQLKAEGIESSISIKDVDEEKNTVSADFKVKNEDKEKAEKIFDLSKDRTIEELKTLVAELEKSEKINDKDAFSHEFEDIDKEKVDLIKNRLEANKIKTSVKIKQTNKDNPQLVSGSLKVQNHDKEKAEEIINLSKDKSIEELRAIVASINKEDVKVVNKEEIKEEVKEEVKDKTERKKLDTVIDKAKETAITENKKHEKVKTRSTHEER